MDYERLVMAQGTFDVIHPGHLEYLRKSKKLGDKLVVVVARDSRLDRSLVFSEDERKKILEAINVVDQVILGSEENIFETLELVSPNVITLGYDQEHDEEYIEKMAEETLHRPVKVERIDSNQPSYSSSEIKKKLREEN